eukprot:6213683-Pleurochrysis_carterae.AAC.2
MVDQLASGDRRMRGGLAKDELAPGMHLPCQNTECRKRKVKQRKYTHLVEATERGKRQITPAGA